MKTYRERVRHAATVVLALLMIPPCSMFAQGQGERLFNVEPGGTLRLALASGNVHLSSWDKKQVSVKALGDDQTFEMEQNGNTVAVTSSGDVDIRAIVPERFNISLTCGSGDIAIDGPLEGTIKGKTNGGEITLGTLSGTITITTSGGEITGGNMQGNVTLTSSGGNLQAGNIDGEISLRTDGGDITVKDVASSITGNTSGGNIAAGKVGGNVRLATSGGDIAVGPVAGECTVSSSGGNIVVHGCGGKVTASTAGGDLALENLRGGFSGATSAGTINAQVVVSGGSERRDGTLKNGGGDIVIDLPPEVSATIKAHVRLSHGWHLDHNEQRISSDYPSETYHRDERTGEIDATYRLNGGNGTITLESSGGSITIRNPKK
jgi:hypothetical protein